MSVSLIEIKCTYCKQKFTKKKAEYKYQQKQGRRSFCSRSCSSKQGHIDKPRKGHPISLVGQSNNRLDEYTPFRWFMKVSKRRDKEVNIDLEYLRQLWLGQNCKCPYTGWDLILPRTSDGFQDKDNKIYRASLDRIDCSKGYIKGNVQFISFMANIAKGDMTDEEMFEFCAAVANSREGVKYANRTK